MSNTQFTELQMRRKLQCFLAEARLDKDVAYIGKMSPYAVLQVRDKSWKSQVAKNASQFPLWNDAHLIEVDCGARVEVSVWHNTWILGDVEVGRATVDFDRLPLKNEWIELHKDGILTGRIRVTLIFTEESTVDCSHFSTRDSSHNSADFKDDIVRKLQELEQERKELKEVKYRYQEKLNRLKHKPDPPVIVNDLKTTLDSERTYVSQQEARIKEALLKLKGKSEKLNNERCKLRKYRDELKLREEDLLRRREELEHRRRRLSLRSLEIEKCQAEVLEEFRRVQKDRQKLNVQTKISAISKRHVTQDKRALLRRIQAQKAVEGHFSPQIGNSWQGSSTECEKENIMDSCLKASIPRSTGKAPLSPLALQMIHQVRSGRLICF